MKCEPAETPGPSPNLVRAEVVRLALSGDPLPSVGDTLRWGDLARRAAMSRFGRLNSCRTSPALSGKGPGGQPLRGHRHTFYLPTDEDGDGRLDHLTLFTPGGLDATELAAVASVDALSPGGKRSAVRVSVEGIGTRRRLQGAAAYLRGIVQLAVADALCPAPPRQASRPAGTPGVCARWWMARRIRWPRRFRGAGPSGRG